MAPTQMIHDQRRVTRRQRQILEAVQQHGFVTIEVLARQFEVSSQTIRRDIIQMEKDHFLQRFHGGAGLRDNSVRLGYAQKQAIAKGGKEAIGHAVARLIPEGVSVFLDVGTTVEAVAKALLQKARLQIFTCSTTVAAILNGHPGITTFVTGGILRGANGSLTGSATVSQISQFRFDFSVMSFGGFDRDGTPMDFDLEKIAVRQAVIAHSSHAIAVVDSSKFDRSAVCRLAPLTSFFALATDAEPPPNLRRAITEAGAKCIVANANGEQTA